MSIYCPSLPALPRRLVMAALLAAFCLLAACGPKDVGEGSASKNSSDVALRPVAEEMRYPVMGATATEQRLYVRNNPVAMELIQQEELANFTRSFGRAKGQTPDKLGIAPEDPAYRAVPQQRSPFKQ